MSADRGFIQLVIILLLSVLVLSLLGVSLQGLFNDKTIRENFVFVWQTISYGWRTYVWPYIQNGWGTIKAIVNRST